MDCKQLTKIAAIIIDIGFLFVAPFVLMYSFQWLFHQYRDYLSKAVRENESVSIITYLLCIVVGVIPFIRWIKSAYLEEPTSRRGRKIFLLWAMSALYVLVFGTAILLFGLIHSMNFSGLWM